ncbi:MAG: hypothetical protein AB1801_27260, partial [Chloroflexota bacterium]
MLSKLTRKLTTPKQPERSITLRLIILAAMLAPLLAIARVAPLWPHVLLAATGITLGHWYSYHNLEKNSQLLRGVMFIAIHLALVWLFVGLFQGLTVPQAQFAIFTQAIASFDLRYRRSLFNTLIHSLANLYVAASLSRTYELAFYLLLFAGLVLAVFFVAGWADGQKSAKLQPATPVPGRGQALALFGVGFGAAALPVIFLTF